jgi:hypothetical protein
MGVMVNALIFFIIVHHPARLERHGWMKKFLKALRASVALRCLFKNFLKAQSANKTIQIIKISFQYTLRNDI